MYRTEMVPQPDGSEGEHVEFLVKMERPPGNGVSSAYRVGARKGPDGQFVFDESMAFEIIIGVGDSGGTRIVDETTARRIRNVVLDHLKKSDK